MSILLRAFSSLFHVDDHDVHAVHLLLDYHTGSLLAMGGLLTSTVGRPQTIDKTHRQLGQDVQNARGYNGHKDHNVYATQTNLLILTYGYYLSTILKKGKKCYEQSQQETPFKM